MLTSLNTPVQVMHAQVMHATNLRKAYHHERNRQAQVHSFEPRLSISYNPSGKSHLALCLAAQSVALVFPKED